MGTERLPKTLIVSVTRDPATPHSGGIGLELHEEGVICTL
ncbi:alpha/beta hydrolase [Nodosilinea nodulosa]|nr:alpha/beta hydrolase [Nodosilinea nodulosa]